jgi:hypothetical protein
MTSPRDDAGRVTATTITDDQLHELLMLFVRESCSPKPRVCYAAVRGYETCCKALGKRPVSQHIHRRARTRCAELYNAREIAKCVGRTHRDHATVTCNGMCCTACGGPIDENEECRC